MTSRSNIPIGTRLRDDVISDQSGLSLYMTMLNNSFQHMTSVRHAVEKIPIYAIESILLKG